MSRFLALIFAFVFLEQSAWSQIGLTARQVNATKFESADKFDVVMGSRSIDIGTAKLSMINGRVACIRSRRPVTSSFSGQASRSTLANCTYLVNNESKRPRWRKAPEFIHLFPSIGEWSYSSTPIMRKTNKQTRTVTYDAKTGSRLGASPWSTVMKPTGYYINKKHDHATIKTVLVSDDRKLFATVTDEISATTYESGKHRADSSGSIVMIFEAGFFWDYVTANITRAYDYTKYEKTLRAFVGSKRLQELTDYRTVVKFILQTEYTDISINEIKMEIASAGPRIQNQVVLALSRPSWSLSFQAQSRQLVLISELGSRAEFSSLVSRLVSKRSKCWRQLKPIVLQAIHALATRHRLKGLPDDDAIGAKWRAWAKSVK